MLTWYLVNILFHHFVIHQICYHHRIRNLWAFFKKNVNMMWRFYLSVSTKSWPQGAKRCPLVARQWPRCMKRWPQGTKRYPGGTFLCPGVNFLCSSSATLKLNLHLILTFFKKTKCSKITNSMMITNLKWWCSNVKRYLVSIYNIILFS